MQNIKTKNDKHQSTGSKVIWRRGVTHRYHKYCNPISRDKVNFIKACGLSGTG
jgi:hypothetical protein